MLDLTHFLIGTAWAQDASGSAPPAGAGTSAFMNIIPLFLILAVFYFLIIRPQQKKMDEQAKMIKALQRGDRVITSGGIHGKIVKLDNDEHVTLEIADGVQIKLQRAHIAGLAAKTQPVAADSDESQKK